MLLEIQDHTANNIPLQIFASDLSIEAINLARIGEYSAHQLVMFLQKDCNDFFTKLKINIAFVKSRMCFVHTQYFERSTIFKMDLISCPCAYLFRYNCSEKSHFHSLCTK
jgi:two-component system CheB/CheR fusion protein